MFGVAQDSTLTLKDGSWIVGDARGTSTVPLFAPAPKAMTTFSIKVGQTWVVWDERGLTVRKAKIVRSTKFADIPTSPKVQPKVAIQDFLERVKKGEAGKDASGISGWEVVGDDLYLIVRWNDTAGEPWLETLMKLNTADAKELRPAFLSRLNGLTDVRTGVKDELYAVDNKLVAVVGNSGGWGLATWDLQEGYGRYQQLGDHLSRHAVHQDSTAVLFTETEPYGAERAGVVDLKSLKRTDYFESRGTVKFVQFPTPVLGIAKPDKLTLHVADSGLENDYPADSAYSSSAQGIILWTPKAKPESAWLIDPVTLKAKATWQRSIPATPIFPNPAKSTPR